MVEEFHIHFFKRGIPAPPHTHNTCHAPNPTRLPQCGGCCLAVVWWRNVPLPPWYRLNLTHHKPYMQGGYIAEPTDCHSAAPNTGYSPGTMTYHWGLCSFTFLVLPKHCLYTYCVEQVWSYIMTLGKFYCCGAFHFSFDPQCHMGKLSLMNSASQKARYSWYKIPKMGLTMTNLCTEHCWNKRYESSVTRLSESTSLMHLYTVVPEHCWNKMCVSKTKRLSGCLPMTPWHNCLYCDTGTVLEPKYMSQECHTGPALNHDATILAEAGCFHVDRLLDVVADLGSAVVSS